MNLLKNIYNIYYVKNKLPLILFIVCTTLITVPSVVFKIYNPTTIKSKVGNLQGSTGDAVNNTVSLNQNKSQKNEDPNFDWNYTAIISLISFIVGIFSEYKTRLSRLLVNFHINFKLRDYRKTIQRDFKIFNDPLFPEIEYTYKSLYIQPRINKLVRNKNEHSGGFSSTIKNVDFTNEIILQNNTYHLNILSGNPGSGKSLYCKYLMSRFGEGGTKNLIPILISLSKTHVKIENQESLLKVIQNSLSNYFSEKDINKILAENRLLIIIDGLDELNDFRDNVDLFLSVVCIFCEQKNATLLCTIRTNVIQYIQYTNDKIRFFDIDVLNNEDIKNYVTNYTKVHNSNKILASKTLEEIETKSHFTDKASNPLILSIICSIAIKNEKELPDSTTEFYESCINEIVDRIKARRPKSVIIDDVIELIYNKEDANDNSFYRSYLQKIAYDSLMTNRKEIDRLFLKSVIEDKLKENEKEISNEISKGVILLADFILDSIKLFVKINERNSTYVYIHKSFQEFLCGEYILRNFNFIELKENLEKTTDLIYSIELISPYFNKDHIDLVEFLMKEKEEIFLKIASNLKYEVIEKLLPDIHILIEEHINIENNDSNIKVIGNFLFKNKDILPLNLWLLEKLNLETNRGIKENIIQLIVFSNDFNNIRYLFEERNRRTISLMITKCRNELLGYFLHINEMDEFTFRIITYVFRLYRDIKYYDLIIASLNKKLFTDQKIINLFLVRDYHNLDKYILKTKGKFNVSRINLDEWVPENKFSIEEGSNKSLFVYTLNSLIEMVNDKNTSLDKFHMNTYNKIVMFPLVIYYIANNRYKEISYLSNQNSFTIFFNNAGFKKELDKLKWQTIFKSEPIDNYHYLHYYLRSPLPTFFLFMMVVLILMVIISFSDRSQTINGWDSSPLIIILMVSIGLIVDIKRIVLRKGKRAYFNTLISFGPIPDIIVIFMVLFTSIYLNVYLMHSDSINLPATILSNLLLIFSVIANILIQREELKFGNKLKTLFDSFPHSLPSF